MGMSRTCSDSAHVGAFCSTTTVIGLPSTPARNASRQPQARRAWVKPLSMIRSYYRAGAQRLKKALDVGFVLVLADEARILPANSSIAADEERRRDAPHRPVGVLQIVAIPAHEHRVVHLEFGREGLQQRRRVVGID